jgi:hypothetical protein
MELTNTSIAIVLLAIALIIQWAMIFKLHKEVKNLTFMMGIVVEANHDALMKNVSDRLANITKPRSRK